MTSAKEPRNLMSSTVLSLDPDDLNDVEFFLGAKAARALRESEEGVFPPYADDLRHEAKMWEAAQRIVQEKADELRRIAAGRNEALQEADRILDNLGAEKMRAQLREWSARHDAKHGGVK